MKKMLQLVSFLAGISFLLTACGGDPAESAAESQDGPSIEAVQDGAAGNGIIVEENDEEGSGIIVEESDEEGSGIIVEENDEEGSGIIVEENDEEGSGIIVEENGGDEQSGAPANEDGAGKEDNGETEGQTVPVVMDNLYTTRFEEVNMVTYPSFTFQYPDNWSVTEENVTQMDETVVLTNERGVTVTFSYIGGIPEDQTGAAAGSTVYRAELSKVGESAFVPGYVQATDYSSLGTFIVAKVEYTGSKEGTESADFTAVDGETLYAVLPESRLGTDSNVSAAPQMQFSFWYAGHISMIAESPDGTFTPQEEFEVLSILGTFRVE